MDRTIEQVQDEADNIMDKSLDSTRKMIRLVEQSIEAAEQTSSELVRQHEQLDRIDKMNNGIKNANLKASKTLTRMESIWSRISKKITGHKHHGETKESRRTFQERPPGTIRNTLPEIPTLSKGTKVVYFMIFVYSVFSLGFCLFSV